MNRRSLVLASGSRVRTRMLSYAGVPHAVVVSDVDEAAIKRRAQAAGRPVEETVLALARAKADAVASTYSESIVIGADQMLVLEEQWFDKPTDMVEARERLRILRGREHRLIAGTVVSAPGVEPWSRIDVARLTMRDFSDHFLDDYLREAGPDVCSSVGAYQLEGLGAQLFDRIDGDFFAILGMSLLPLLAELRARGLLAS